MAGLLGDAALDDAAQAARTTPGAEAPMDTPSNGSYMTVYVPSDYDAGATWPLILCYHGARGRPTTWPFRQATGGEGFIVAGLEYGTPGYASGLGADRLAPEIAHVEAVLEQLQTAFSIDPDHIFMGGFSQGGYSTTVLGERLGERLAGLAILGAGRVYVDRRKPAKAAIWRKPVFVGCGTEDTVHYPRALAAAAMYRRWGANVTFEDWSGVGHTFDASRSSALGEWLRNVAANETTESSRFGGVRVRVQ
ncbi:MAG: hypothetical protein ABGY41_19155 [Candidatus Poribacteria bacterium]